MVNLRASTAQTYARGDRETARYAGGFYRNHVCERHISLRRAAPSEGGW